MTRLPFIFIIFFCMASCKQSIKDDCNRIKTEFYSTGKIQDILSLNNKNLKNGECFYFNKNGFLDSSVTFSDGILQGMKRDFYNDGSGIDKYDNGSLISHSVYDSSNILIYKTPLDIKTVGKTQIKFFSNRNYVDQNKIDTFSISNAGLPYYNRGISVIGAIIKAVGDTTFSIRTTKHSKELNQIIIKVLARQNISDTTDKGILIDSTVIPVK